MSAHRRFARVGRWHRGYRPRQVDRILDRLEHALSTPEGPAIAAADIRRIGFDLALHGYEPRLVDAALDELELRALARERDSTGRRGRPDPSSEAAFLVQELSRPYGHRFPRAGRLGHGYDVDDVDDFVDRVLNALTAGARLEAGDVRSVAFSSRLHGYDEQAVDDLLDRVVDYLLQPRDRSAP